MTRSIWASLLVSVILIGGLWAGAAHAQTRTWVSGVGDDANPCSRTAPCKTFAGAMGKTAAGGEINCVDAGGFGAVTINKAMAIKCDNTEGGVVVSATNGITVSAGANDIVYLSGLDIEGFQVSPSGVQFNSGAALHIHNCTIRGFANGVNFTPSAGIPELYITDSIIADNEPTGTGNGVLVAPTAAAAAVVDLRNVRLINDFRGLQLSSAGTTGILTAGVTASVISGNTAGVGVAAVGAVGKGPVTIVVDNSNVSQNQFGLLATGASNVLITIGRSVLTGNGTAFSPGAGGLTQSYGDNDVESNGAIGAISPGGAHH